MVHPPGGRTRKQPTGDHFALIRAFTDGWSARNGGRNYPFNGAKDGDAAKFILANAGSLVDATRIVAEYLADDDPFLAKKGHPLSLLRSNLPAYLAKLAGGSATANDAAIGNVQTYHPDRGELDPVWAEMAASSALETAGGVR